MIELTGYQILDRIYSGTRTLVYRGTRTYDETPVVIKVLRNEYPSFSELVQFRNQYTIAKNLNLPGIIQTYSLEAYQNGYALIVEDFGGISLNEWTGKGKTVPSLVEFLLIAIDLCNTLDILCRYRIIHKDIKPANILINPTTKQIKLIDFSIASLLPRETQTLMNSNVLEGTLSYLSPEQTGRMNRGIDYRTDFYSLGVTFYELLTGQLPYISNDPMDLVYCHLAKQSIPIHQVNSEIPLILSQIISKLMAKNAENRYQSALGLKQDLEICLAQLQATDNIKPFVLGTRDITDRFLIPEKLYGRETEVSNLLAAFERVSQGATEMMLVAGFSGIGKTAVVNEVHKPIVKQRGYFIKGKYDQFQRNIPFSAFVQAFRDLMGQLLSQSDAQLQRLKSQILTAVGDNGQVLIEVIPELEKIIGTQPPAPELSGNAAKNRFNLLIQKFVQIFTQAEHPLVMFLDDLQWADSASLKLLQLLMQDTGHLLVLGAYRDNEVSPIHPLILTVDEIVKAGATVNTITLQPLSHADMNQLVADTLIGDSSIAQPLTEVVYQKTKGNPFFATQFLKALHDDGLITFDWKARYWQCDLATVRVLAITDDVVKFMALQLQKLPIETEDVLKLAACIGAQFDLNTLAIVSQQSPEDTATALWKALQEGLIIPTTEVYKFFMQGDTESVSNAAANPTYRFLHDRVQQAAYSLIPDKQKQITHLQIGRLLQQATTASEQHEQIFAIVNHLNKGISLIEDEREQYELAQLNLIAAQKAKGATAYGAALNYFNTGISLLNSNCWQSNYNLALALYEGAANSAFLNTNFEQIEQFAGLVLTHARSCLDRINIYETKIQACVAQNQHLEALRLGREVLKQLGVHLAEQPTQADIEQALVHTQKLLNGRSIESLLELPEMTAPEPKAAMVIISNIMSAAHQVAPDLLPLLTFVQVDLSVQYGNAAESTYGYVQYGLMLVAMLRDINPGYRFGQLGMNLLQRIDAPKLAAKTIFGFNTSLRHWREPAKDTLDSFLQAYASGLETGDLEYVALSLMCYGYTAYFSGQELSALKQTMDEHRKLIQQFRQDGYLRIQSIYYQAVLNLLEPTAQADRLCSKDYDEDEMIQLHLEANQLLALFQLYFNKLILSYLFHRYEQALENARLTEQYLGAAAALIHVPLFSFYDALVRLAIYPTASETEQTSLLDRVAAHQAKLQEWATHAPSNQAHRCALVAAERCRVLGEKANAIDLYDRAIQLAKENEYIQEEALANELCAKFYLDWGKEKVAQSYIIDAYYAYSRWGAKAKVQDLETRYGQLLTPILQKPAPPLTASESLSSSIKTLVSVHHTVSTSSSSSSISEMLDIATVLKAAQSLYGAIELDELLSSLMQVVMENAGADKAVLILNKDGNLEIAAQSFVDSPCNLQTLSIENCQDLPVNVIYYVKRTEETVISTADSTVFASDSYLIRQHPQSFLCTPILNQGKLIGILYLENSVTAGAFTADRIELLKLLCSQAAISLENARLYQKSQQALENLKQAQIQLVQSEKMSALGNLVAGIAHEINNPVGFLKGNLEPAIDGIKDLFNLIDIYQQEYPDPTPAIQDEIEAIDLDFLRADLPNLVGSMAEGIDRICNISISLRTFSRADSDRPLPFNIHEGIDSTLMILKHRLKASEFRPQIEVVKDYGNLPAIECFAGQLNQVFMNFLANAIDALEDSNSGRSYQEIQANPNRIAITTTVSEDRKFIIIRIKDNGIGMSESVQQQIFEHLFTTKAVGKGTGLGLAIARQIVLEKHRGTIEVNSVLGEGTEFAIALPCNNL